MTEQIGIVIPTYQRGQTLLETLDALMGMSGTATELIIVDQTPQPPVRVAEQLVAWERDGSIRWIRIPKPSIPRAMNTGLLEARSPIVLFLDDDIVPLPGLIQGHAEAYQGGREQGAGSRERGARSREQGARRFGRSRGKCYSPARSLAMRNCRPAGTGFGRTCSFPFTPRNGGLCGT